MRYRVSGLPTAPRASYLVCGENVRSEAPLERGRETQMSDDAPSSHLGKRGRRTRQPAAWPSSQRRMFATVSW
jgi:hypothetical protein